MYNLSKYRQIYSASQVNCQDIWLWYKWKTFFRTTVSIPPILGQSYQIQPYGPPRADENLQRITDNDDGSDCVLVVAIWCNRRHKLLTLKMTTSDRRRNSQNYSTQKNLHFCRDGRSKWQKDETPVQKNGRLRTGTVPEWWSCRRMNRFKQVSSFRCLSFRRFVVFRSRQKSRVNFNSRQSPCYSKDKIWLNFTQRLHFH